MLIALGLAAGVLVSEAILRTLGFSYPIFFQTDYYLGQVHRPSVEGWSTREGRAYATINKQGFRDHEHLRERAKDVLRIAVLGDSYVEGFQVPVEATFPREMERDLGKCSRLAARRVEVLNFGVGGYGTAQELIALRRYVWNYSPDLVILAFTTGNDLSDNSFLLDPSRIRPFFRFDGDRLFVDESFRKSLQYRLLSSAPWRLMCRLSDHSRLLQLLYRSIVVIRERRQVRRSQQHGEEPGLEDMVYREPRDPVWRNAWRVTEELLRMMHEEVRGKGAQFLVVTLSNPPQVSPDLAHNRVLAQRLGVPDLFYPERRVAALGKRDQFAVLNLAPLYQAYAKQHQIFLHGFSNTSMGSGHWNAEGHRLGGELIAGKVCEMLNSETAVSPRVVTSPRG